MIGLEKVNLKNIRESKRLNFEGTVCFRCQFTYFDQCQPGEKVEDSYFYEQLPKLRFTAKHDKYYRRWLNEAGDSITVHDVVPHLFINKFQYSFTVPRRQETLYLLEHLDDFKLDVAKAIKIAELNRKIEEAQNYAAARHE